jgi:tRNA(Ile)-lysidine synthase
MFDLVKQFLDKHHYKTFWIAYSGGLDSTVLLHLVKRYQDLHSSLDVKAIHINHNLSKNANDWCHHTGEFCNSLNIPLIIKNIESKPKQGDSLEAWARENRYHCFESFTNDNNICILLAHHQDDQAETFLLNALRGSGLPGLSSMPYKRQKNGVTYLRPLLSLSRNDIEKYAVEHNLNWVEDESNLSLELNRNYLRHSIIPKLNTKWTNSSAQLAKSAKLCSETNLVLNEYICQDLNNLLISRDNISGIDISKFSQSGIIKSKLILKYWLNSFFDIQLPHNEYGIISRNLEAKENGWQYQLNNTHYVQKYNNVLSISKVTNTGNKTFKYTWDTSNNSGLYIPELKQTISVDLLSDFGLEVNKYKQLVIRSRQPKDRCTPSYRKKSQKLKVIFQELKIPSWDRKESIIIEDSQSFEILAVYPYFICKPPE